MKYLSTIMQSVLQNRTFVSLDDVDPRMVDIIKRFLTVPGVATTFSCSGHTLPELLEDDKNENRPHVIFGITKDFDVAKFFVTFHEWLASLDVRIRYHVQPQLLSGSLLLPFKEAVIRQMGEDQEYSYMEIAMNFINLSPLESMATLDWLWNDLLDRLGADQVKEKTVKSEYSLVDWLNATTDALLAYCKRDMELQYSLGNVGIILKDWLKRLEARVADNPVFFTREELMHGIPGQTIDFTSVEDEVNPHHGVFHIIHNGLRPFELCIENEYSNRVSFSLLINGEEYKDIIGFKEDGSICIETNGDTISQLTNYLNNTTK